MADADSRRLNRLTARAKKLDDVIQKAAQMNKHILEEIRRIGSNDRPVNGRLTKTRKPKRKRR